MEFLRSSNRRSLVSNFIYSVLNIVLAAGILIAVVVSESAIPAIVLVLLSKWRIFAVRPRYWFVNLQSNLVDVIVSLSVVVLLFTASGALAAQILITLLYIGWLLYLKPKSRRSMVVAQAGVALFFGVTALYTVSFTWPAFAVVVLMWLIGYAVTRHALSAYDEKMTVLYALVGGLVMAELGWITYHWTAAYSVPFAGQIQIPQVAILAIATAFALEVIHRAYRRRGEMKLSDVLFPVATALAISFVVVVFFSATGFGQL